MNSASLYNKSIIIVNSVGIFNDSAVIDNKFKE